MIMVTQSKKRININQSTLSEGTMSKLNPVLWLNKVSVTTRRWNLKEYLSSTHNIFQHGFDKHIFSLAFLRMHILCGCFTHKRWGCVWCYVKRWSVPFLPLVAQKGIEICFCIQEFNSISSTNGGSLGVGLSVYLTNNESWSLFKISHYFCFSDRFCTLHL